MSKGWLAGLGVGLILFVRPLGAQPYDLAWYTVDGGGGTSSTGGPFALGATIGQPDAGGPFAGGSYVLHSGFWSFAAGGTPSPQADLEVTKTDGQATAIPGQLVTYTILVGNVGPTAVTGATVTDAPPASLLGVTWTCMASPGSTCPASGAGGINDAVALLVGGSATFSLTGTIAPDATGTLANSVSVTAPPGVIDPNLVNNSAMDTDTLDPRADLSVTTSDSPDPVGPGGLLTYTLQVANLGPSSSPGTSLTDTLPGQVAYLSTTPGPPACTHTGGVVTCVLGALPPAGSATVTLRVAVGTSATGSLVNSATVTGSAGDPNATNNTDLETTQVALAADGELVHGTRVRADLAGVAGSVDVDLYRIRQEPHASYEVVLDETSGDIGVGSGPALERVAADGTTVLQSAQAVGAGPSRSLRFQNTTAGAVADQFVRVRSAACGSDCGADDVYRLRAWETTGSIARFNNSTSQVTVVILQNRVAEPVAGRIHFWAAAGTLVRQEPFGLGPRATLVLNTAAIAALAGQGGSVTVTHDGPHGALAGKVVAVEPATGFSFDSPLETRRR